ncbi:MAG: Asp-tRNA(Asn)/Glu-tRNA(Gln) amidotransferase subunit GatC [Lactobacillales bacterium]|jgi:aspartyl-tRNA(Asn)/glutamyl-tRNA(Gln) amidotransferase subunit C|nr:Asp-tRNA(Asn)/Glu-tRNA(Gln) amidotransferase subunit GatC [Lactobacillales bacterium]
MTKINVDQVNHVAKLAFLKFDESEVAEFTQSFDKILNFVEQLDTVDVDGIEFLDNVSGNINVMRNDDETRTLPVEELMANVPERDGNYIKVPTIIDKGEGA